jgi:perosamine synthetase
VSPAIPVNTPLFSGNELDYITDCIKTGWVSSEGPYISQFESGFSHYVEREYGIAVANGSAALDIAIKAAGIEKGDEVIMPAFTIISPAFSIVRAGAIPVLVDADPVTWNMDVTKLGEKITAKTKAIIVVHIYGMPVDMDPVLEIAQKHNITIIEDAAEMHGQTYKGKKCGSFGAISIFSFYPNKLITTGEGGMIVTDDKKIASQCRKLRNLAFEPDGPRFVHNEMGWNYRMTNMQAAIGVAQLEKIEDHLAKKKGIGRYYNSALKGLTGFQQPIASCSFAENVYWVYGLVGQSETLADKMKKKLNGEGVGTRPFFWSMHEQPVFQKIGLFKNERYPVAEKLSRNGFYIPSGLGLTTDDQNTIISLMLSVHG